MNLKAALRAEIILYINANNGREEKILMLIESENGILTV